MAVQDNREFWVKLATHKSNINALMVSVTYLTGKGFRLSITPVLSEKPDAPAGEPYRWDTSGVKGKADIIEPCTRKNAKLVRSVLDRVEVGIKMKVGPIWRMVYECSLENGVEIAHTITVPEGAEIIDKATTKTTKAPENVYTETARMRNDFGTYEFDYKGKTYYVSAENIE